MDCQTSATEGQADEGVARNCSWSWTTESKLGMMKWMVDWAWRIRFLLGQGSLESVFDGFIIMPSICMTVHCLNHALCGQMSWGYLVEKMDVHRSNIQILISGKTLGAWFLLKVYVSSWRDDKSRFVCLASFSFWSVLGLHGDRWASLGALLSCPEACGNLISLTRDWTFIPCAGKWILNQWTTREVPVYHPSFTLKLVMFVKLKCF